jgi:hypothetical protein
MRQLTTRTHDHDHPRSGLGGLTPGLVLGLLCPLIVLSFVVGVALAATTFPTPFDVRQHWISSLASAKRNPSGFFYMGAGLAVVSLLLLPLRSYLARGPHASPVARSAGAVLLLIGLTALFLLAVETTAFPNYGRDRAIHKVLTCITLPTLTLGFLTLTVSRVWMLRANGRRACLACGVLLAPAAGTVLTGVLLSLGAEAPGWAGSSDAKATASLFRTLPFWEWVAVTGLFAGGYLSAWAVTPHRAAAVAIRRAVGDTGGRSPTTG